MNSGDEVSEKISPAVQLGNLIRQARQKRGWTISALAEKLGRPREWLNRVELGYSEYGEYRPINSTEIQSILKYLKNDLPVKEAELEALQKAAQQEYFMHKSQTRSSRAAFGKLTHTEIIIGEKQIVDAIVELVKEQHSDAIIRNTGIKSLGNYQSVTNDWLRYRKALGEFLEQNPNALFKRVEYAATSKQLQSAKDADERLAGKRQIKNTHNAKIKFHIENPLQMHVIIGQREAILALPQVSGQAGSNIALLIRDKLFVEALRVWYDEVLWDAPNASRTVNFERFDDSFNDISEMYGFSG